MLTYHLYWKISVNFTFFWYSKGLNLCNGSFPIAAACMLHREVYIANSIRIESGLDPKDWETWATLLTHQVGIIHKLNYLNVTRILN